MLPTIQVPAVSTPSCKLLGWILPISLGSVCSLLSTYKAFVLDLEQSGPYLLDLSPGGSAFVLSALRGLFPPFSQPVLCGSPTQETSAS